MAAPARTGVSSIIRNAGMAGLGNMPSDQMTILLILRLLQQFGGTLQDFFQFLDMLERQKRERFRFEEEKKAAQRAEKAWGWRKAAEEREQFRFGEEKKEARRSEKAWDWKKAAEERAAKEFAIRMKEAGRRAQTWERQQKQLQATEAANYVMGLSLLKPDLPVSQLARIAAERLGKTKEEAEAIANLFSARAALKPESPAKELLKGSDLPSSVLLALSQVKESRSEAELQAIERRRKKTQYRATSPLSPESFLENYEAQRKELMAPATGLPMADAEKLALLQTLRKHAAALSARGETDTKAALAKLISQLPADMRSAIRKEGVLTLLRRYGSTAGLQSKDEAERIINDILTTDPIGSPEVASLLNLKGELRQNEVEDALQEITAELQTYLALPKKKRPPLRPSLALEPGKYLAGMQEWLATTPEEPPIPGLAYQQGKIGVLGQGGQLVAPVPRTTFGPEVFGRLAVLSRLANFQPYPVQYSPGQAAIRTPLFTEPAIPAAIQIGRKRVPPAQWPQIYQELLDEQYRRLLKALQNE